MIRYAKVIGGNTDFLTAQAFVFPKVIPADYDLNSPIVAAIISAEGEDVFTKIRQAATFVEESFFEEDLPVPERLEKTLSILKDNLKEVENLQIILCSWKDSQSLEFQKISTVLYLESIGSHCAYLLRDEKLINLNLSGSNSQLVSGYVKPGDKFLMLSSKKQTENNISNSNWEESVLTNLLACDTESLEEEVPELMHQKDYHEPYAVLLFEYPSFEQKVNDYTSIPQIDEPPRIDKFRFNFSFKLPPKITAAPKHFFWYILRNRRAKMLALLIITSLLVLSSILIFSQFNNIKKDAQFTTVLSLAQKDYQNAQSQKDSDPDKAQQSLNDALTKVNNILRDDPKNIQALDLKNQIEKGSKDILKVYEITEWPVFLSLDLIKKGFNSSRMGYSLNTISMLDENQKTLVTLNLERKNNQILAGETQLGQAKFASINGDFSFIYSDDKGVLRVDRDTQKVTVVSKPDSNWGYIADIFAFGSNVYLLDSLKNQIWKYTPTTTGYSDRLTYLAEGSKVDFAGAKQLYIDFSVWVLKSNAEIDRFTGGNTDNFSFGGLDKSVSDIKRIFISEKDDKAYLLDSNNSRLLVTKKNGQYLSQYTGEKFKTATDLVVDDENKKIYILEGGKIYQIDKK